MVASYEDIVRSPSITMNIPSVVVLKDYIVPQHKPPFTRFNLYLRDAFECQYCGTYGYIPGYREGVVLTLDHVLPKARGGHLTWDNTVAACGPCNVRKACRTPQEANMRLRNKPKQPSERELKTIARCFPPESLHETWLEFLNWELPE